MRHSPDAGCILCVVAVRTLIYTMKLVLFCVIACCAVASSMFARQCRNRFLDRVKIDTTFVQSSSVLSMTNASSIHLTLSASWEVVAPERFEVDGFLIHLRKTSDGAESKSLRPTNICNLRENRFWVRSKFEPCDVTTECDTANGRYCACAASCSKLESKTCIGLEDWALNRGMFSVQAHVRNVEFKTEFDGQYFFKIYPYLRESVSTRGRKVVLTRRAPNCVGVLINKGIDARNASKLCCNANIVDHYVRNATFGEPSVDFDRSSIAVMVQWIPPITRQHLLDYDIRVFSRRRYVIKVDKVTEMGFGKDTNNNASTSSVQISQSEVPARNLNPCNGLDHTYSALIDSLLPSTGYTVRVTARFARGSTSCASDACHKYFSFRTPEVNICDPKYKHCDDRASCNANGTFVWNATCTCEAGFQGNGLNRNRPLGTGCSDEDICASHLSPCSPHAHCSDKPAPEHGTNCACPLTHHGDGLKDGSGCQSRLGLILAIGLISTAIVVLLLIILLRRMWVRRRLANDLKWSEFVANQSLKSESSLVDSYTTQEVYVPMFGEAPELDRNDIVLSDVIGRGNYGVVYKAYYDAPSDYGEEQKRVVAVKTLQDNASRHVMDFLSEIGLMLNIGDHPNILSVVGCCTTQTPILLVTEFLKYGDLLHFLWNAREPEKCLEDPTYHLTEQSLYYMSQQVAYGMEFLTKSRVIHGDLAARNILVGEQLLCKISDFGLANDVYRYGVIKGQQERCVPFNWISPERMMTGKVPITSKSDVWSFGNLMYEMVTLGCTPHSGIFHDQLLDKFKSGYRLKQPSTCSDTMYSIMSKCWRWRPYSRPSFTELVRLTGDAMAVGNKQEKKNLIECEEMNSHI